MFKQTKELNLRLYELEAKLQQSIEQVHAPIMQAQASSRSILRPSNSSFSDNKELGVNFPEKFDGTRSKFQGFINQIQLITLPQLQQYSIGTTMVVEA